MRAGVAESALESDARRATFEDLARRRLDASYGLAYAILGNRAEAEDATHDALIQAWRGWSTLREHASFNAWFDRIVVNTCRNRLRSSARHPTQQLFDDITSNSHDPVREALDRDALGRALATLSPDHRLVVALRYYRDMSVEEIATQLHIPAGTVRSRLHYATRRLHDALDAADDRGSHQ